VTTTTTAATTTAGPAEVTTTSSPYEPLSPRGRPDDGAAAARTEELYARYNRTVTGLCRALLRDRAEAEDAAQQTFLSAHRALLNGNDPREPAAWLATIARNECWARIRTRMREPLAVEEVDTVAGTDPLAEAIRRADLAALWAGIEELPPQQRDALLLREFGGLSYEELAEALAVSGSAVESLLFRARTRLRVQLRAGYAALSGVPWIEALARAFAGGSAPVAAKVAALGVGAAAVGGSAVVVPHVLENHTHMRPLPVRTTPHVVKERPAAATPELSLVPVQIAATALVEQPVRSTAPAPTTRVEERDEDGGQSSRSDGGDRGRFGEDHGRLSGDDHSGRGRGGDDTPERSETSRGETSHGRGRDGSQSDSSRGRAGEDASESHSGQGGGGSGSGGGDGGENRGSGSGGDGDGGGGEPVTLSDLPPLPVPVVPGDD
jgi:RNA polymerase sigma-70 factor, ECF subfamily